MANTFNAETLVAQARSYLSDLSANNSRDWFHAHKSRYEAEVKQPAEALLAALVPRLETLTGTELKPKLFRPQRDLRFSKDKTPYHTHMHLSLVAPDGRAWMIGIASDYATFGAGVMGFDKAALLAFRAALDGPEGETLETLVNTGGWRLNDPDLARVPAPFAKDHPRGALLRRKGLMVWSDDLEARLLDEGVSGLANGFEAMAPVMDWLGAQTLAQGRV